MTVNSSRGPQLHLKDINSIFVPMALEQGDKKDWPYFADLGDIIPNITTGIFLFLHFA